MEVKEDLRSQSITFVAIFAKATTLVDGGWRITFDLNEDAGDIAAELNRHRGHALTIAVIPFEKSGAV